MKRRNLTTTGDISIEFNRHYMSDVQASFYNDWTVRLEYFYGSYKVGGMNDGDVIGEETIALFPLFIFALCQACGKFLDDSTDLDEEVSEQDMICLPCLDKELKQEQWSYYQDELSRANL